MKCQTDSARETWLICDSVLPFRCTWAKHPCNGRVSRVRYPRSPRTPLRARWKTGLPWSLCWQRRRDRIGGRRIEPCPGAARNLEPKVSEVGRWVRWPDYDMILKARLILTVLTIKMSNATSVRSNCWVNLSLSRGQTRDSRNRSSFRPTVHLQY